jgi:transmembrane sensor
MVDFNQAFRRVALKKGGAHFQVAKNSARPFVVEVSGVEVRAVGTEFAVQIGQSAVEVLVTEGRVAVRQTSSVAGEESSSGASGRSPIALVDAGHRVVVSVASLPTELAPSPVQAIAKTEIAERLAWRSPGVEFSGAPLGDVVAFLNRHNPVELVIEDSALKGTALSGRFRLDDTEAFVRMIETGFGVTSSRSGGRIILRKAR